MLIYLLAFVLATSLSLYGVPLAREAAIKYKIMDFPDKRLKKQKEPVPYLGGLAIYISFLLTSAFTYEFRDEILGIILAGTLILLLGLIDDFGVLTPKIKIAGQLIAIFVLIRSGIMIKLVFLPYWFQIFMTFIWLLGTINAFNIIDVMDGLSAGTGFFASIIIFSISLIVRNEELATISITLAGSLLGFLWYNFNPAKIYMGDAGSMFIGLMLGALTMIGSYTKVNSVASLAPILILGVPIFDTLFVSYIRYRRGISIFLGSHDHFALRMRKIPLTDRQVVVLSYLVTILLGVSAIAMMMVKRNIAAILFLVISVIMLVIAAILKKIDTER
ncbi:MAG: MraY family glycosyltransferase [Nitrospirota bacterium]